MGKKGFSKDLLKESILVSFVELAGLPSNTPKCLIVSIRWRACAKFLTYVSGRHIIFIYSIFDNQEVNADRGV